MTNDKINAVIAEACGWKRVNTTHRSGKAPNADYVGAEFLPDYCNDLNVMHQVEKTLTVPEWYDYATYLNPMWTKEKLIHATAFQRAEAYLKTIGKWEGLQA
jgi:hypothetical protein